MKEFECQGVDGNIYIHNDNWLKWRHERFLDYPCQPNKFRFDITISKADSHEALHAVPTPRNPHHFGIRIAPYSSNTCFYACEDWSTIHGIHETGHNELRMLIESGNPEPLWGERIKLFSTSSYIENEPWGTNPPNRFVCLRGRYYRIVKSEFLHDWNSTVPGYPGYPLRNPNPIVPVINNTRRITIPNIRRIHPIMEPLFIEPPTQLNPVMFIPFHIHGMNFPILPHRSLAFDFQQHSEQYTDNKILINNQNICLYTQPPQKRIIIYLDKKFFLEFPQVYFVLFRIIPSNTKMNRFVFEKRLFNRSFYSLYCYFVLENRLYIAPLPNIDHNEVCLGGSINLPVNMPAKERAKAFKEIITYFWQSKFTHAGQDLISYMHSNTNNFLTDWESQGLKSIKLTPVDDHSIKYNPIKMINYYLKNI